MSDRKDLATEGRADRLEGTGVVVEGRIRNVVGGATGKTSEQLKGKAKELAGKAKQAIGKAKESEEPGRPLRGLPGSWVSDSHGDFAAARPAKSAASSWPVPRRSPSW